MNPRSKPATRPLVAAVVSAMLSAAFWASAQAADPASLAIPGGPISGPDTRLSLFAGPVEVIVKLADAPLAVKHGPAAKQLGSTLSRAEAQAHAAGLKQAQDAFMAQARTLGGREIGRFSRALNGVALRIDASRVAQVEALPGVVSVRPVGNYRMHLSSTVPYIGAAAAQAAGKDGSGVKVAVLDSGVDYTHRNLGGDGTLASYNAAYAARDTAYSGFPTAKVYGGYDFVGEQWPNGDLAEDPNPIDLEGHGTHVADIIAGKSLDGKHLGVAPGAKILAVKVCSAVSTSCSGVALLKGVDFALDPNGDGDLSDAVDVMNLSLGSAYGQKEDDLSEALANAVRLGVVVVASAGNDGDRPYIVGSPSTTPEVISVAQTQVPSAVAYPLVVNSPASIAGQYKNTATVDFAPIGNGFTGDVAFVGRGCPAGSIDGTNPDDPYLANPAGKVALIDRGQCAVSAKVRRASQAGAIGVLIGLVAAGDAISFSNGGDCPTTPDGTCKPTLVIVKSTADLIKANITAPVNVTVSPAFAVPLTGSIVGSSARGPSMSYNAIKPDIGAPGASVSAVAGSGTGEEAFGGTSGAAPMVSGSAAILVQAFPKRSPAEIKAALMNAAETQIQTNPATLPGVLAPITRIGGGEVRVDRALAADLAAWDAEEGIGSLSFGYHTSPDDQTFTKTVRVRNYGPAGRSLRITPSFRYADDENLGAVSIKAPPVVVVPGMGTASFEVKLKVKAAALSAWTLNGGSLGGNGPALNGPEFDGYLTLADREGAIHLAWQVLPHKAADIALDRDEVRAGGSVKLRNDGVVPGRVEVFSLTGTSPRIKRNLLPQPGDAFAVIDLKSVGVRQAGDTLQFAINTFGERAHPNYPAEFDIYIDIDGDGEPDYVVYNSELGGFAVTGQNVVSVLNLKTHQAVTRFFSDADLNSSNIILTAALSDLGIGPGSTIGFDVYAFDNYFTGNLTDAITGMRYTPATPRLVGSGIPPGGVPVGGKSTLEVRAVPGGETASPSQTGLLLLYRDGKLKREADTITVRP